MTTTTDHHDHHHEGWDETLDCHYKVSITLEESYYENDDCDLVHQLYIDVHYVFTVASDVVNSSIPSTDHVQGGRWCLEEVPRGLSGLRREVTQLLDRNKIPLTTLKNTIQIIFNDVLDSEQRSRLRRSARQVICVFLKIDKVFETEDPESEEEEEEDTESEDEEEEEEDPMEDPESEEEEEEDPMEDPEPEEEEEEDPMEDMPMEEDEGGDYNLAQYDDMNEVDEEEDPIEEDEEFGRVLQNSMEEDLVRVRPAKRRVVEALRRIRVWSGERDDCVICMEGYLHGGLAIKMPCSHVFHSDCLVEWLGSQCFCPLCRFELPCEEEEEA